MSNKKKGNSSFWISTIIAFLLSVFLTLASYLGGIYFGLFNNNLILDALNSTNYYNAILDNTSEKAAALAIPMGLPADIFNNVFTLDSTYSDGRAIMQNAFKGESYTLDTSDIENRITSNINIYLTSKNLTATPEQQNNINEFAQTVAGEYVKNISIPYINYYVQLRSMFSNVVMIGLPVLLLLSAAAVFLLIRLHRWLHRSLRYITYGTLAAAIMTGTIPLYALISGSYRHLNVSPEYFYNFLISYITQSIVTFLYISLLLFVISFALITVIYFRRKELKKKSERVIHRSTSEA